MSGAGSSGQAGGSNLPQRLLASQAAPVVREGEMLPVPPAEAGPAASQSATRGRQTSARSSLRGQSGLTTAISQTSETSQQQLTHAQRQLQGYSQQINYPWYQAHRSAPFQQGIGLPGPAWPKISALADCVLPILEKQLD